MVSKHIPKVAKASAMLLSKRRSIFELYPCRAPVVMNETNFSRSEVGSSVKT